MLEALLRSAPCFGLFHVKTEKMARLGLLLRLPGRSSLGGSLGIDPVRFRVNVGFDFSACTQVGYTNCSSNCTISGGAQTLATYIKNAAPPGDVILIGFSLGGLIARDLIFNNYGSVLSGRAVTLITLGTPSLGYPYAFGDAQVFCPNLVQAMQGNWRAIVQPSGWPSLSSYLLPFTQSWQGGSFPGTNGYWFASAGQSCSNPLRSGTTSGCRDSSPLSDGVVCADSAAYNIVNSGPTGPVTPTPWSDSNRQYVHSNAGLGIATSFVLCGNGANTRLLSDPRPDDALFQTIVAVINGR